MKILFVLLVVALVGCSTEKSEVKEATDTTKKEIVETPEETAPEVSPATTSVSAPSSMPASAATAMPASAAIKARVADAEHRLMGSEAGKKLWASIEAHGGLETWYANGPIGFRFTYAPVKGNTRDTYQVVDTWASRAHHKGEVDGKPFEFGWDGQNAWQKPADMKMPTNPRFWSLTPYYFVGLPFVLADRGVVLAEEAPAEFNGKTVDVIRATFEGVGDAPDDFYVVYLDQKDSTVEAIRYIVTYKGFFPDGGHSPEKLMMYEGAQSVKGITLPTAYRTYKWDGSKHTELVTNTTLTELSFLPETKASTFAPPEGAKIQEGW